MCPAARGVCCSGSRSCRFRAKLTSTHSCENLGELRSRSTIITRNSSCVQSTLRRQSLLYMSSEKSRPCSASNSLALLDALRPVCLCVYTHLHKRTFVCSRLTVSCRGRDLLRIYQPLRAINTHSGSLALLVRACVRALTCTILHNEACCAQEHACTGRVTSVRRVLSIVRVSCHHHPAQRGVQCSG